MQRQVLEYYKTSIEQFEAASFKELAVNHEENYREFAGGDVSIQGGYIKLVEKLADGLDFR